MSRAASFCSLFAASVFALACGARTGDDDLFIGGPGSSVGGSGGSLGTGGRPGAGGTGGSGTGGVGGMPGGDCCSWRNEPGCSDEKIQACVCAGDPFCCNTAWDDACVDAAPSCGAGCLIGTGGFGTGGFGTGGFGTGGVGGTGGFGTGGFGTGGFGGTGGFVGVGGFIATGGAMGTGGSGTGGSGGSSNGNSCCVGNSGTAGCVDPEVQQCVCFGDPYCCYAEWDELCASEAGEYCGGCPALCAGNESSCLCLHCGPELASCNPDKPITCAASFSCGADAGCF